MNNAWIFLGFAIIVEVIATAALKGSENFTKLIPTLVMVIGYGVSFYLLTFALKTIPIGTVYAIWSGAGIALITLVGYLYFNEKPNNAMLAGIGLIIAGIVVINLFGKLEES